VRVARRGTGVERPVVLAGTRRSGGVQLRRDCFAYICTDALLRVNAGVVYSGMGPDFRVLVRKGQKRAQQYYLHYGVRRRCATPRPAAPPLRIATRAPPSHRPTTAGRDDALDSISPQESIPVLQLVRDIAAVMQEFTQSGGVRPFGVSLLIAGCVRRGGRSLGKHEPNQIGVRESVGGERRHRAVQYMAAAGQLCRSCRLSFVACARHCRATTRFSRTRCNSWRFQCRGPAGTMTTGLSCTRWTRLVRHYE
jgi:hypothetical protein